MHFNAFCTAFNTYDIPSGVGNLSDLFRATALRLSDGPAQSIVVTCGNCKALTYGESVALRRYQRVTKLYQWYTKLQVDLNMI